MKTFNENAPQAATNGASGNEQHKNPITNFLAWVAQADDRLSRLEAARALSADDLLSIEEAARAASVSTATIRRAITDGRLPAIDYGHGVNHLWRIRRGDLARLRGAA